MFLVEEELSVCPSRVELSLLILPGSVVRKEVVFGESFQARDTPLLIPFFRDVLFAMGSVRRPVVKLFMAKTA